MFNLRFILFFLFLSACTSFLAAQTTSDTLPLIYCGDRDPVTNFPVLSWDQPPAKSCGAASRIVVLGKSSAMAGFTVLEANLDPSATTYQANDKFLFIFQIRYEYDNCPPSEQVVYSNVYSYEEPFIELRNIEYDGNDVILDWFPYRDSISGVTYLIRDRNTRDTLAEGLTVTTFRIEDVLDAEAREYEIFAIDACGNLSPPLFVTYILVVGEPPGSCATTVDLEWSAFPTPNGAVSYEVQFMDTLGNWQVVFTTSGLSASIPYPSQDSLPIRIRALTANGLFILSNTIVLDLPEFSPQTFIEISNASFDLSNELEIDWSADANADIDEYLLVENGRSIESSPFIISPWVPNSPSLSPNTQYVIRSIDSCGNPFESLTLNSPILRVQNNGQTVRLLTINALSDQHSTINYEWFNLRNGALQPLDRTNDPILELRRDEISDSACFVVIINSTFDGNPIRSQSNLVCFIPTFLIFAPNVIQISSSNPLNQEFLINTSDNSSVVDFFCWIYDRTGALLYQTNDIGSRWKPESNNLINSTLVYRTSLSLLDGRRFNRTGTFIVLP